MCRSCALALAIMAGCAVTIAACRSAIAMAIPLWLHHCTSPLRLHRCAWHHIADPFVPRNSRSNFTVIYRCDWRARNAGRLRNFQEIQKSPKCREGEREREFTRHSNLLNFNLCRSFNCWAEQRNIRRKPFVAVNRAKELVTFEKCDKQFNKNEEQRCSGYQWPSAVAERRTRNATNSGRKRLDSRLSQRTSAREMPQSERKAADNGRIAKRMLNNRK